MTADHILNAYRQALEDPGEADAYKFAVAKGIALFVPRRKPMMFHSAAAGLDPRVVCCVAKVVHSK
jgi:hypothetical protein